MKNSILLFLVFGFCLASAPSFAQADNSAVATTMTKSVDDQVNLSQSQYDQVYSINMAYLMAEAKLDRTNLADGRFYAERNSLNAKRLSDLSAVLSASQRAALTNRRN